MSTMQCFLFTFLYITACFLGLSLAQQPSGSQPDGEETESIASSATAFISTSIYWLTPLVWMLFLFDRRHLLGRLFRGAGGSHSVAVPNKPQVDRLGRERFARMVEELEAKIEGMQQETKYSLQQKDDVIGELKDKVKKQEREKAAVAAVPPPPPPPVMEINKLEIERDENRRQLTRVLDDNMKLVQLVEDMKAKEEGFVVKVKQLEEENATTSLKMATLQECVEFVERCKVDLELAVKRNSLLEQELENAKQEFYALQQQLHLVQQQQQLEATRTHRELPPPPPPRASPSQPPLSQQTASDLIDDLRSEVGDIGVGHLSSLENLTNGKEMDAGDANMQIPLDSSSLDLLKALDDSCLLQDDVVNAPQLALGTSVEVPRSDSFTSSSERVAVTGNQPVLDAVFGVKTSSNKKKSPRVKGLKGLDPQQFSSNPMESDDQREPVPPVVAGNLKDSDENLQLSPKRLGSNSGHKSLFDLFDSPLPDKDSATDHSGSVLAGVVSDGASAASSSSLVRGFAVKADANKIGLRRAKKNVSLTSAGKPSPQMEDAHFCKCPFNEDSNKALFGVFDGHAGRDAADTAVDVFPKEFASQLSQCSEPFDITALFKSTFSSVDKRMAQHEYCGSTATVAFVWKEGDAKYLQAANLGDSSAYLCRDNVAVALTFDHKPTAPLEKERMRAAGIEISDRQTRINGLAVSRSLGNHFVKEMNIGMIAEPYISECFKLLPSDSFLIIASDGLWDIISGQAAVDIVKQETDPQVMASTLLQTALQSAKCNDNVTVMVIRL